MKFRSLLPLFPLLVKPLPYPTESPIVREEIEKQLSIFLGIPDLMATGLFKSYGFYWKDGHIRRLRLSPNPKIRRVPGIEKLKAFLLGDLNLEWKGNKVKERKRLSKERWKERTRLRGQPRPKNKG